MPPTDDPKSSLSASVARLLTGAPPHEPLSDHYLTSIEPLIATALAGPKFAPPKPLAAVWKAWPTDARMFGLLACCGCQHAAQIYEAVYRGCAELAGKADPFKGMLQHLLTLEERGLLMAATLYLRDQRKRKVRLFALTDAGIAHARSLNPVNARLLEGVTARPFTDSNGDRTQANLRLASMLTRVRHLEHKPLKFVSANPLARRPIANPAPAGSPGRQIINAVRRSDYQPIVPNARLTAKEPDGSQTDVLVFLIGVVDTPGTRDLVRRVQAFLIDGYHRSADLRQPANPPVALLITEDVDQADELSLLLDRHITGAIAASGQPAAYWRYPARERTLIADQHSLLYRAMTAQLLEALPPKLRDDLGIEEQYPEVQLFPEPTP